MQLIRQHYESNHGMRLERAIERTFHASFKTMLLTIIEEPVAYYAHQVPERANARLVVANLTWSRQALFRKCWKILSSLRERTPPNRPALCDMLQRLVTLRVFMLRHFTVQGWLHFLTKIFLTDEGLLN